MARLDEKQKLLRNFARIFESFQDFFRNLWKCIILAYFSKNLTNHALIFCAFGRKCKLLGNFEKILEIFDENSIEKLNFYIFFGSVAKTRAFGNNIIFLRQFFRFRGGGFSPFPLATPFCLRPSWCQHHELAERLLAHP